MKRIFRHLRARLTVWHTVVFGALLLIYAAGTSLSLSAYLRAHLDESLKEELEVLQELLVDVPAEPFVLEEHRRSVSHYERFLEIWSADGSLLYRSGAFAGMSLGPPPDPAHPAAAGAESITLPDGSYWRVLTRRHTGPGRAMMYRLAVSEDPLREALRDMLVVTLAALPLALILIAFSARILVRNALRPIDSMVATARGIGAGDLRQRLPVDNPDDELGHLANTLNELLGRLEASFDQLRRFTADASHELRTPLAAMRSVGEVALQQEGHPAAYREAIGSMLEENERLGHLVDCLLTLSRADAGVLPLKPERMDLFALASEVADLLGVLAEEKKQTIFLHGPGEAWIAGDRVLLRQALINLVDNAIRYSPTGSTIDIRTAPGGQGETVLEVADEGPGIGMEEREKVFLRFYRSDVGRSGNGAGLGLALVRWVAEAHGGAVTVRPRDPVGSIFIMTVGAGHQFAGPP